MDHLKPKCSVTTLDCCVEGQGHSECSKVQFVLTVMSELLNLFITRLVRQFVQTVISELLNLFVTRLVHQVSH